MLWHRLWQRRRLIIILYSLNLRQLVHSDTHEEENKPVIKFWSALFTHFQICGCLSFFFFFAFTTSFWAPLSFKWKACTSQDLTQSFIRIYVAHIAYNDIVSDCVYMYNVLARHACNQFVKPHICSESWWSYMYIYVKVHATVYSEAANLIRQTWCWREMIRRVYNKTLTVQVELLIQHIRCGWIQCYLVCMCLGWVATVEWLDNAFMVAVVSFLQWYWSECKSPIVWSSRLLWPVRLQLWTPDSQRKLWWYVEVGMAGS